MRSDLLSDLRVSQLEHAFHTRSPLRVELYGPGRRAAEKTDNEDIERYTVTYPRITENAKVLSLSWELGPLVSRVPSRVLTAVLSAPHEDWEGYRHDVWDNVYTLTGIIVDNAYPTWTIKRKAS